MAEAYFSPVDPASAPSESPVAEGGFQVGTLAHLPAVLRRLGLEPDAMLRAAGVEPELLLDWRNVVQMANAGRLLAHAVSASGCDHVGLLVGERAEPFSLGLVGMLAQSSPDVGTALHNLHAHVHLRDRGAVVPLEVAGDVALLGYEIYQPGVEAVDQFCDASMAIGMNLMRALCGAAWRPTEVLFAHRAPSDLRPFRRIFGPSLHFDAPRSALVFEAKWLAHRTQGADPESFREFMARVLAAESQEGRDLVVALRRMLRTSLLSGSVSVGEMGEQLSMHRRTLNRRLRASGTSLHQLLEEARFDLSRQLIEYTRMPLTEVAATLGYADSSAFTRAFKRWTGQPPSAWRKQHPAGAVANCHVRRRGAG